MVWTRRKSARIVALEEASAVLKGLERPESRYYGDGGTIHHTTALDVEVCNGQVVAVWFRCQPLPFKEAKTSVDRAREMRSMYQGPMPSISALQLIDPKPEE